MIEKGQIWELNKEYRNKYKDSSSINYVTITRIYNDIIYYSFNSGNKSALNECEFLELYQLKDSNHLSKEAETNGNHYKDNLKIDAYEIAYQNKLDAYQFNTIKYVIRHPFKNGIQDIEKAIKTLQAYKTVLENENQTT